MKSKLKKEKIIIVDFGSQVTKLIARRVRENKVYSEILTINDLKKKKYLKMLQSRYISTLLSLTKEELQKGMNEINYKYNNNISFFDKLICVTL